MEAAAMTAEPVCYYCQDTGWTAAIDANGDVCPVTCPDGCPATGWTAA